MRSGTDRKSGRYFGPYLLPVFHGNPGLHSSAKEVSQVLT